MAANGHTGFRAEHCLFEFQRYIFTQIGTALGAAAPARTAAEKISKAEKVSEDLADILENRGVEPARSSAAYRSVPEAIVRGPLVGIGQDRVGFAAFFEFFFGIGIIRIAIRMELQRQLAVGALNFLFVGFAGNPKYFVIIAFYVAGQNSSSPFEIRES